MSNFYDELGVPPTATADEIDRAYRFLVQKFHPDRNPGHESEAQAHFLRVQIAYETLSDSSKRAAYDKSFRQDQFRPAHISQPNNFEGIKIPWKVRRKRPDIGIRIWLSTAAACLVVIVAISVTKNDTKDKTQSLRSSVSRKEQGDSQKPDGIGSQKQTFPAPVPKPFEPNPPPLDKNVPEAPESIPPAPDTPAPSSEVTPVQPAPQKSEMEPPEGNKPVKITQDRMALFFADFRYMLKNIGDQPTTIKRDEMRPILVKKLDENLYTQTWTFHCRISDVKADPDNRVHKFIIVHDVPDEMSNLDTSWTTRTSAELLLPREQATHLNPGNYIVYSGTPQLVTVESYSRNKRTDGFLLDEHDGFALCLMHVQAGFPNAKTP